MEELQLEYRFDHKTCILICKQATTIHLLALGTLYSTFALSCCSLKLILGKISSQLESLFLSLAALKSDTFSPTFTLAMYLEWHLEKASRLYWKLTLLCKKMPVRIHLHQT